ncbi:MAG TPA: tetratricopeptide repeat protein [Pyrinomonadaceae bacterium]
MSRVTRVALWLILGLSLSAAWAPAARARSSAVNTTPHVALQGRNRISGHVFAEARRPVPDIYVELMDEVYTTIARARTNGSGFYSFEGLSTGNFKLKVLPYGTDFEEQTRDITIYNISVVSGAGASSEQVDFYLKTRGSLVTSPFAAPGTVFAQDVPEEARKHYERGVALLGEKKDKEAFDSLKRSLEIFPRYYMALDRLGTEYVLRGYKTAAYILLTEAVKVNPRGFSSLFGLGMSEFQLGMMNEAAESFRRATLSYDGSINAHMYLGLALKRTGKLAQAEASLKRARDVGKGQTPEVHWHLARLYGEQKRYAEAADSLELYLKTQPQNPDPQKVAKIQQVIRQLREKATKG